MYLRNVGSLSQPTTPCYIPKDSTLKEMGREAGRSAGNGTFVFRST
jgi:hypothetical protein